MTNDNKEIHLVENFADAPKSLTEARAEKLDSAKEWTVRDMLISTLREIDSGEIEAPTIASMVMGWPDGTLRVLNAGGKDAFSYAGLLAYGLAVQTES